MAITRDQLNLLQQNTIKAVNAAANLTPGRDTALVKTCLERAEIFIKLTLKDIGGDDDFKLNYKDNFNFDSVDNDDRINELVEFMSEKLLKVSKEQYLAAFDTPVPAEARPFFPAHMITTINCFEEALGWIA